MDSNNPYSNYQDFISSQGYYPNLDNIQNSEEFLNSDNDLNSQFSQNPTQSPISEDHQPPANISQNFLQNSQLPQTNTSSTPKAWTSQEDIMLMSSWCIISENPAIGTDQKSTRFWNGIWELYKRSRRDNNIQNFDIRTSEALRARYKRHNQNVTKWIGCYKEAYRQRKSGWSNDDIEDTAQKLYGRSKFSHKDVFVHVMRRHPNWEMDLSEEEDDIFAFSTERIATLKKYMANRTQLRDREAHNDLQNDLIEHIWQKFGDDN